MKQEKFRYVIRKLTEGFTVTKIAAIILGAAITTFGIYNIHQQTHITEGGVIGMVLLLHRWFGISPGIATTVLDLTCYILAFRYLGHTFLRISIVSTLSVSAFYKLWECFPPLLPNLSDFPLLAALLGGVFVGIGVGIIVRQGGSSGGDDALALTISRLTHWRISRSYLLTDMTVLLLSLSYIPFMRIGYSLITVTTSSLLIDFVKSVSLSRKKQTDSFSAQKNPEELS